ncbi:MAG: divalent-cation tolerance protein CutA [Leptospirales bacterium]
MSVCLLLFSHPDPLEADRLVSTLVSEKQVSCGHLFPVGVSIYEWEGKLVRDQEVNVLLKLSESSCESVTARIRSIHPYAVPEILYWTVDGGNPSYLEWVMRFDPKRDSRS